MSVSPSSWCGPIQNATHPADRRGPVSITPEVRRRHYLRGNRGAAGRAANVGGVVTTTWPEAGRPPVGELLREWRERRRLSQLDLAIQADISARHLSFVETGRSRPTPTMILRLTEQLAVPLRERNVLLLAAGYAPAYPQHVLEAPELDNVRVALGQVLAGHEPYPAVVVDRWWDVRDANSGLALLTAGCAPALLKPPVNALRLALHPDGMAPRIVNLPQWRGHLLTQLQHRASALGDQRLRELHDELLDYPGGRD